MPKLKKIREQVEVGLRTNFLIHGDGSLRFGSRICVPCGDIRDELLREAHSSTYAIHPGGAKMYMDIRLNFWWHGMKRSVARSVAKCFVLPASEGRTSMSFQTTPTTSYTRVEMTAYNDGFYD